MPFYRVWNENDPNDCFEVAAGSAEEAAVNALDILGWQVSNRPVESGDMILRPPE